MLIRNRVGMFTTPKSLLSAPVELRIAAEGLVELAKTQACRSRSSNTSLQGISGTGSGQKWTRLTSLICCFSWKRKKPPPREMHRRKKPLPQSQSRSQSVNCCNQNSRVMNRFSAPVRRANAAAICAASARM